MIITQTPFRMSFFGGGTDYPEFYKEYGGSVMSTSFDKYCFVTVRHLPRFFEYSNQITYSVIERTNSVDEIEHPAVREAMKFLNMHELRIIYEADLPARSGLGSSSSFAVGLLNAFHALKGEYCHKKQLAEEAIYLERTLCKEHGGVQDQIAAAYGGFNRINFSSDGFDVTPVIIPIEKKSKLNDNLMLFFTGFSRFSSDISAEQERSMKNKISQLKEIASLVDTAEEILENKKDNLDEFGRLLHYTWELKRGLTTKVSSDMIDEIYQKGRAAGALGGKLLGAGGGGFLLFYVDREYQSAVREALKDLLYVPFRFENYGSRVLYYSPEIYEFRK